MIMKFCWVYLLLACFWCPGNKGSVNDLPIYRPINSCMCWFISPGWLPTKSWSGRILYPEWTTSDALAHIDGILDALSTLCYFCSAVDPSFNVGLCGSFWSLWRKWMGRVVEVSNMSWIMFAMIEIIVSPSAVLLAPLFFFHLFL